MLPHPIKYLGSQCCNDGSNILTFKVKGKFARKYQLLNRTCLSTIKEYNFFIAPFKKIYKYLKYSQLNIKNLSITLKHRGVVTGDTRKNLRAKRGNPPMYFPKKKDPLKAGLSS